MKAMAVSSDTIHIADLRDACTIFGFTMTKISNTRLLSSEKHPRICAKREILTRIWVLVAILLSIAQRCRQKRRASYYKTAKTLACANVAHYLSMETNWAVTLNPTFLFQPHSIVFQPPYFCFFKASTRCPTAVVQLPHNCGAVASQLWCNCPTAVGQRKYPLKKQKKGIEKRESKSVLSRCPIPCFMLCPIFYPIRWAILHKIRRKKGKSGEVSEFYP